MATEVARDYPQRVRLHNYSHPVCRSNLWRAFSGGTFANGTDVLQLFANAGGRSGNFSAVNATGLAAGQSASFNAATGYITIVPEPSTCAMALAGLARGGYSLFRRRTSR